MSERYCQHMLTHVNKNALKSSEILCLLVLCHHADEDGNCYITLQQLGREMGVTKRFAAKMVAMLTSNMLVRSVGDREGVNRAGHYIVLPHFTVPEHGERQ